MKPRRRRREGRRAQAPLSAVTVGVPPGEPGRLEVVLAPEAPPSWPSISVCMIVKNEAGNLRPCLESLGDLASEVIVVDTGSTDNTAEIAREMGARVYHFPWVGDFAAARNESIRHAKGEWIFWLDADDRLDSKARAQLKQACRRAIADAYMCLVSSRTSSGNDDITEHIRLFRNRLGIRFSCAVHESVFQELVRRNLRLAYTDITIEHTGYLSAEAVREKGARNLRMIETELTRNPGQLDFIFYRGQSRATLGDMDGAEADMSEYLARTVPGVLTDWRRFWAHTLLIRLHERRGDTRHLEQLLSHAQAEFPGHPQFLVSLGRLQLLLGRPEEAEATFETARTALERPVRFGRPSKASVELGLAECQRLLGRTGQALTWAEKAKSHPIHPPEATALYARLCLEAGKISEAESAIAELQSSQEGPGPWLLLSRLRQRQGRLEEAAEAIHEAQARGLEQGEADELTANLKASAVLAATRTTPVSRRQEAELQVKGLALLARKEMLEAAACFAEAVELAPSNPDNYRYLAVALRGLGREQEALEAWRLSLGCKATETVQQEAGSGAIRPS